MMPVPIPFTFMGASFSPAQLFVGGIQGAWYDPSDFSTMFQDSAGTTPVTTAGQPVGLLKDKSGNNNDASQTTLIFRPTIQQDLTGRWYLLFDGVDDSLRTNNINFTATNKMTFWAGVRKESDALNSTVVELGTGGQNGSFYLMAPNATANARFQTSSRGTVAASASTTNTIYNAPITAVVAGTSDISAPSCTLIVNNIQVGSSTASQGTGSFSTYPIYICSRASTSQRFNGRLYSLIVRGAQSTSTQISNTNAWVNTKTGAY